MVVSALARWLQTPQKHYTNIPLYLCLFRPGKLLESNRIPSCKLLYSCALIDHLYCASWMNVTGGVCRDLGFVELQLIVCDSPGLLALQLLSSFLLHVIFSQLIWLDHLSKLCQAERQTQENNRGGNPDPNHKALSKWSNSFYQLRCQTQDQELWYVTLEHKSSHKLYL